MRFNLLGDSIEDDIADLQRFIQEAKTAQFTSQDSGMLARIARAQLRNQYGDVVQLSGDLGSNTTSQIQCPATPSSSHLNSIYATQLFIPERDKPAVAVPLIKLKVDSGGLHGESELYVGPQWGIDMPIYNASNVEVGRMFINQALGGLFKPIYHDTYRYAWETQINYRSSVPFTLSYEFTVRSSHEGTTSSQLNGLFF